MILCCAELTQLLPWVVRLQVAATNQINDINNFFPSLCGCLQILTALYFQETGFQSPCQPSFPCTWCTSWLSDLDFRGGKCTRPEGRSCAVCVPLVCAHVCVLLLPRGRHTLSRAFGPALRDAPLAMGCSVVGFQVLCVYLGLPRHSSGPPALLQNAGVGHGHPPADSESPSPSVVCPCRQLGGGFCSAIRQEGLPRPRTCVGEGWEEHNGKQIICLFSALHFAKGNENRLGRLIPYV